ncbi:FKBP-type peptidyl-prolyl cis-trans isomerase [Candidatus Saccharibacteria bacterium]|nr:MAG: FKBP-type peptidyl-prolyl cis-trans isomerase [Candidatus Saccharibacteria bacterium]
MVKTKNDPKLPTEVACDIQKPVDTDVILPAPEVYKPDSTLSAIQTTDLEAGSGEVVKAGDCMQMKYYGTLASDGTLFDENFSKNTLLQFNLGEGRVIQGWDKGLEGMKVGGTRRLAIPASLGYGANGQGSIPPNSDLVFVVKLVKVQK